MKRPIVMLALLTLASCSYGMTAEKFQPARDPHGVETHVTTASGELRGELIELQDSGMIILSSWNRSVTRDQRSEKQERVLRLVPYASISLATFEQLKSDSAIRNGVPPTSVVRERLRLVSRFPYGMSEEVLGALLKAHGQVALAGIQP